MTQRDVETPLGRVFFHLQSKSLYEIHSGLLRDAGIEWENFQDRLPENIQRDFELTYFHVHNMLGYLEDNQFAKALDTLSDAYKEYQELMKFFPSVPSALATTKQGRLESQKREARWEKHDVGLPESGRGLKQGGAIENSHKLSELRLGDSSPRSVHREHTWTLSPTYEVTSPVKLAERFNNLYTEHWTAAFEEVSKVTGDVQAIRHMLWVIAKASNLCVTTATQQLDDLEAAASGIMICNDPLNKEPLPSELVPFVEDGRKVLVQYRKELAALSVATLKREMREALGNELGPNLPRKLSKVGSQFMDYAEKCVELVWLMYVQDPPLHLEWLTKDQEGETYDTELYRPYTKSGAEYDYCVWPVLRKQRGGPVLSMGVAQGR